MNSTHFGKSKSSKNSLLSRVTLFFLLTCLVVPPLAAQYYERSPAGSSNRFVHLGYLQRTFEPRYSNASPDSLIINYRRVMPTIGFREGMVDVTFGFTRFSLRGQDKTSIYAGITVGNEFPLTFSATHGLLLPLMIASDYTRSDNTGTDKENFNIGSLGIGAGLKYRYRQPRFEFSVHATEAVHWSFEGFNTGTGFSAATTAELMFAFRNAVLLDGITLGYRFRYQTWSMNNDAFDYKALSHGAFLGVLF